MATVPVSNNRGQVNPLTGKAPSESEMLMALAEMRSLGRLGDPDPQSMKSDVRRKRDPS